MIHGLFKYRLFGQEFWNHDHWQCRIRVVMLVLFVFALAANRTMRHAQEVPGFFQNIVEMIVEMLDDMVEKSMGSYAKKYRNYIGSIFIFIFVSNISGLFGLRPPTADYGVTLPLGIITFCIIQYKQCEVQQVRCIYRSV